MTGAPAKTWFLDDDLNDSEAWAALLNGEQQDFVMTAGTSGSLSNDTLSTGLISGHAYSVLSAHEVVVRG